MASTYLSKTQGSGNRRTWTFSGWFKLAVPTSAVYSTILSCSPGSRTRIWLDDESAGQQLAFEIYDAPSTTTYRLKTNRSLRDYSAWYNLLFEVDSTQATASNRTKIYINGVQETSFSEENYVPQNYDFDVNNSSSLLLGSIEGGDRYYNGSMAHTHFIDGTAYDADTFGETDATTGIWKPKTAPSVTYGTNGFFLKFENSGAFGTDSSGNANNFTVNGTMTQTIDTPSNVFATLNPLHFGSDAGTVTMSQGNLTFSNSGNDTWRPSTMAVSQGKWYAEFKTTGIASAGGVGINNGIQTGYIGSNSYDYIYGFGGIVYNNDSNAGGSFTAPSTNDIIGVALDLDNNKIYWSLNGTFLNSGDPTSGATGTGAISISSSNPSGFYHFVVGDAGTGTVTFECNFGNGYFGTTPVSSAENPDDGIGIFEYTVPTGYKALCTKSINAQEYS